MTPLRRPCRPAPWIGVLLLPLAASLAACEGAKPGGIYSGTLTSTANNTTYNLIGAVTEDGAVQLINTSTPSQYSGQLAISTSKTTGSGTLRFYNGAGDSVTTGTFKGVLGVRTQITGTYTADNSDRGALSLSYNAQYNAPVSLATASGTYRWTSPRNNGVSTMTFGSDGALSGTTEYGCPFTGTASVTNTKYDLFSVTLRPATDSLCGNLSGTTLGGLAYYTPGTTNTAAVLTTTASNDAVGYFANFVKQ